MAAFILAAGLSYLGAEEKFLYWYNIAFLLGFLLCYFILGEILTQANHTRLFLKALYLSTLAMSVNGFIQYLAYRNWIHSSIIPIAYKPYAERFYRDRIFATYGQPNNMALYISMGLLIGLHFMLEPPPGSPLRRFLYRLGLLAGAGLQFFAIEASGGLGLYGALAGLAVFAFGIWRRRSAGVYPRLIGREKMSPPKVVIGDKLPKGWLLGIGVLILGIFILCQRVLVSSSSWQRTTAAVTEIASQPAPRNTITHRLHYWLVSGEMLITSPLWGVGLGNFNHHFSPAQGRLISRIPTEFIRRNATFTVYAHNEFIRLLAETGLPGFLLAVFIFGLMAWRIARMLRENPNPMETLIGAFFAVYTVHLLVSNPFQCISLLILWAFITILWKQHLYGGSQRLYKPSVHVAFLLLPSLLVSGLILGETAVNIKASREIMEVIKQKDQPELLDLAWVKTHSPNPYFEIDLLGMSGRKLLKLARQRQGDPALLEQAGVALRRALQIEPESTLCGHLAEISFGLQKDDLGLAYLKQGIQYVTTNVGLLQGLLQFYQRTGDQPQMQYWQGELKKYSGV